MYDDDDDDPRANTMDMDEAMREALNMLGVSKSRMLADQMLSTPFCNMVRRYSGSYLTDDVLLECAQEIL